MSFLLKAQQIVEEMRCKHFGTQPISPTIEPLLWSSCGLMGDNKVYGYAWSIGGIPNLETNEARAFLKEASMRLTAEVIHDDGTRFVRVMAEVLLQERA
jgi:hypothetical protein